MAARIASPRGIGVRVSGLTAMRPDLDAYRALVETPNDQYTRATVDDLAACVPVLLDYIRELEDALLGIFELIGSEEFGSSPLAIARWAAPFMDALPIIAEVRGGR